MVFDNLVAILEICKLSLHHGRSSLVPPYFAIPMLNFTILIKSAGFATICLLTSQLNSFLRKASGLPDCIVGHPNCASTPSIVSSIGT